MIDGLIETARRLAAGADPAGVDARRAVSTAYYALFHALCRLAANELVGADRETSPPWLLVYRGVEHATARTVLQGLASPKTSDPRLRVVSNALNILRDARMTADYDPSPFLKTSREVADLIDTAEAAVDTLADLDPGVRLELATRLIVAVRRPG